MSENIAECLSSQITIDYYKRHTVQIIPVLAEFSWSKVQPGWNMVSCYD